MRANSSASVAADDGAAGGADKCVAALQVRRRAGGQRSHRLVLDYLGARRVRGLPGHDGESGAGLLGADETAVA
jgi:hypothetical protein